MRNRQWLGIGWLAVASMVLADCKVKEVESLSFGTATSYDVRATSLKTSTNETILRCPQPISLPTGSYFKVTADSTHHFVLKNEQGDAIPFKLSNTPNDQDQLNEGQAYYLNAESSTSGNSPTTLVFPLYLSTQPGMNISAGKYTDTIIMGWEWSVCQRGGGQSACEKWDKGSESSNTRVELTITNDCKMLVPTISFGSAAFPADFRPVNNTIQISCTKGTKYYVGIDAGDHPAGGRRQMLGKSKGNKLQYDIFTQNNQLWGDTMPTRVSALGEGSHTPVQSFPFRAQIYSDQAPLPADVYTDQVRVNVYF